MVSRKVVPRGKASKHLLTCFLKMIGYTMYERMALPEIVVMAGTWYC